MIAAAGADHRTRRAPLRRANAVAAFCLLLLASESARADPYDGKTVYMGHCAACHGRIADGNGPLAPLLNVRVADLRYLQARHGGVFPREWVIEVIDGREQRAVHGTREMPVWGLEFRTMESASSEARDGVRARIEALADYLASIQRGNQRE